MTSTTTYRTENGKTLKVESESEKKRSAEKTADNKKQKTNVRTEPVSDVAEVEEI